jgi:hypothetical protein
MYRSYSEDLFGLTHDTLRERLSKNAADSIATCTDEMKIQYVEDLDNVVSMAILTATVLKFGFGLAAPAVLAMLAARFAGQQALPTVQPPNVPAETWTAWVSATGHAFGRKALKETLTYIGTNVVAPTIARTVMGTCEMYNSKQTKQMCIIVVINETDYEITRTEGWDMLEYGPAATFSKLPPRQIAESDLVSWGVWATGSGRASGAASAIKLETTNCPPGGKNFHFIVSASCPAWTPTNTMALTMSGSDCKKECRDNESISSNVTATRRETVGEAHVAVSAELESTSGKRAFVVVRITSTALVSQPKL